MKIFRNVLLGISFLTLILIVFFWTDHTFRPNRQMMVNGLDRTYTIHIPKGYKSSTRSYPVLLVLHGNPSKSWELKHYTQMNKSANENDFIVVYPDALDHKWDFLNSKVVDSEIQYIDALINEVKMNYRIDTERIYCSGISGGGIFSLILANALEDQIAAVCVVAGNMIRLPKFPIELSDSRKPLILIHGTGDFLYNGREDLMSVRETIEYWRIRNDCISESDIKAFPDLNKNDHSTATMINYPSQSSADILFIKIENGGHHWPNAAFDANLFVSRDLGHFNRDFDTNQMIWDFLSQYELR